MRVFVVVGALLCVGLLSSCTKGLPPTVEPLETAIDRVNGSVPITLERSAVLSNSVGPVHLRWGGNEDTIRWTLNRQATGKTRENANAVLNLITLSEIIRGDTAHFFPLAPVGVPGYTFSSEVILGVPFRMPCVINGVQGKTIVSDLGADIVIRNANAVSVRRLNASCDITSAIGGVECEIALPPAGSCLIIAAKGNIHLKIPTNTSAGITALTTRGTISHSYLSFAELTTQEGSLTGRLGAGNGVIRVETGEGNIVIEGILP